VVKDLSLLPLCSIGIGHAIASGAPAARRCGATGPAARGHARRTRRTCAPASCGTSAPCEWRTAGSGAGRRPRSGAAGA